MATESGRPIVVDDLVNGDLRPYRLPFLQRLSGSERVSVTVWHGNAAPGIGAPYTRANLLALTERRVGNVFWPWGEHRVMWQRGALSTLRSESEVIVCAEVVHNLTVWLIACLHRLFGKRLILRGYCYRPGPPRWSRDLGRRVLHRLADAFIAYTERGREQLLTDGVAPDRVFVSQNTLDTEKLMTLARDVDDEGAQALRTEIGLDAGPVLLYLGKLMPVKRVEVAISAVATLGRDVSLVVVGDGHQREKLERAAQGLPVYFRGAIYDEAELAPYFRIADLLVLPGRVGLTCVHGFANGVPCITTTDEMVEQSPEYGYIVDGYNGVVVPTDSPTHYASAIARLLADPAELDRLGRGARETATRLGMETMVDQYERAVLRAMER